MRCTGYEMARYKGTQASYLAHTNQCTHYVQSISNRFWPKPQQTINLLVTITNILSPSKTDKTSQYQTNTAPETTRHVNTLIPEL